MIKVIDGKRYSTESADLIFAWDNGHFRSDFGFRVKKLYRTKSGAWFLYHEGGAMSDMGTMAGRNRVGSESIEPVSDVDSRRFLEKHSADQDALAALEKFFGDSIQDA